MSVVPSPGVAVAVASIIGGAPSSAVPTRSPTPSSALATAAAAASRLNASIASSSSATLPSSSLPSSAAAAAAGTEAAADATSAAARQFGRIVLDISNSVLPASRLTPTPSSKDGLTKEAELQLRSLGCDLIQLAGKLLKLPQVAMATGCVLFQRFYYAKSFVKLPFDIVAMATVGLACKIEETPRRTRDIINVFKHIKQVRSGRPIVPMVLDAAYLELKNQVIKSERRVLKELGFCVHVKHPHKIIVMYLRWLKQEANRELLQMAWNFMNDSLRTDVFVRYPPETIAVACIYLSARKLKVSLPRANADRGDAAWFDVLGVEEDDIKDCCYRMICLYNGEKPNQEELESLVESLRRKADDARRAARMAQGFSVPSSAPDSRGASPKPIGGGFESGAGSRAQSPKTKLSAAGQENGNPNRGDSAAAADGQPAAAAAITGGYAASRSRSRSPRGDKKRVKKHHHHHHRRSRSRSTSPSHERKRKKGSRKRRSSYSRSPSISPPRKSKKHYKDKYLSEHKNSSSRGVPGYDKYSYSSKRKDDYYYSSGGHRR